MLRPPEEGFNALAPTMAVTFKIEAMPGIRYLFFPKLFANNKKLRSNTIKMISNIEKQGSVLIPRCHQAKINEISTAIDEMIEVS